MKKTKFLAYLLLMAIITVQGNNISNAKTISPEQYKYTNVSLNEKFSLPGKNAKAQNKIIRSYKQLKKLKTYIRKKYAHPSKYLKELKTIKKNYFKKNVLIFATDNVDVNTKEYKFHSLVKEKKQIKINVERISTLQDGWAATCVMVYMSQVYIIKTTKKTVKNAKRVKIFYHDHTEDEKKQPDDENERVEEGKYLQDFRQFDNK